MNNSQERIFLNLINDKSLITNKGNMKINIKTANKDTRLNLKLKCNSSERVKFKVALKAFILLFTGDRKKILMLLLECLK
jgi:hypothetical protein